MKKNQYCSYPEPTIIFKPCLQILDEGDGIEMQNALSFYNIVSAVKSFIV